MDIVDKAPVTFLAKNTVHTRVMADDDIVIGGGDTRPSHFAYGNVIASADVGSERFPTDGRVGAAGGIVHERKVTSGSVGVTAVVKDERVGSNGGVLCAGGVEQKRCRAHCGIGISSVEDQRSSANTGVEAAGID